MLFLEELFFSLGNTTISLMIVQHICSKKNVSSTLLSQGKVFKENTHKTKAIFENMVPFPQRTQPFPWGIFHVSKSSRKNTRNGKDIWIWDLPLVIQKWEGTNIV